MHWGCHYCNIEHWTDRWNAEGLKYGRYRGLLFNYWKISSVEIPNLTGEDLLITVGRRKLDAEDDLIEGRLEIVGEVRWAL